jgi:hypothetical protein
MPNNWQPSKQRPKFGHDQNIGRASFGLNSNKPYMRNKKASNGAL